MKSRVWLWPILTTLLCGGPFACTAQDFLDYANDFTNAYNVYIEKRSKPSLSIVNPLDVLRQRLLLEMARRQMRENTKQVEINRQILKNVGKRDNSKRLIELLSNKDTKKDFNDDADYQVRYNYNVRRDQLIRK